MLNNKESTEIVKKLIDSKRYEDLYKLARYCYKQYNPIMSDSLYNKLEETIKKFKISSLVNQSYDDDSSPNELLKEFNLEYLSYSSGGNYKYHDQLQSEKSMSILALTDYRQAYDYFMATPNEDKVISGKQNGFNLRSLYHKGSLKIVLTRARKDGSSAIDVTKEYSKMCPTVLDGIDNDTVIIYGEGIVNDSAVSKIPRRDGESFTSARMAANSIFRVGLEDESFRDNVHFMAFNADGLAGTITETFCKLEAMGFEVVPYKLIKSEQVPKTFEEFCSWLKNEMDFIWNKCKELDLDTDGMVVDINSKLYMSEENNQYLSRNCALKFEQWSFKYYKGKIKNIVIEQQRVNASAIIEIEPLSVDDGSTNRRVVIYNPSFIIENGFKIGGDIYFERDSGAISKPIVGHRLKILLEGDKTKEIYKSNSFTKGMM